VKLCDECPARRDTSHELAPVSIQSATAVCLKSWGRRDFQPIQLFARTLPCDSLFHDGDGGLIHVEASAAFLRRRLECKFPICRLDTLDAPEMSIRGGGLQCLFASHLDNNRFLMSRRASRAFI
jgi:hypothetical protein